MIDLKDVGNKTPEKLLKRCLQSLSESGSYKGVIASAKEQVGELRDFSRDFIPSVTDSGKVQDWNGATKQLGKTLRDKCECRLKIAETRCKMSQNYLELAIRLELMSWHTDSTTTGNIAEKYAPISFAVFTRFWEIREAAKRLDIDLHLGNQGENTIDCNQLADECVYFLLAENGRIVKIGYSSRLSSRIKTLQASNPENLILLKAIPGSKQLEARLHRRFAADRLHGEWFNASPEIMEYIKSL